MYDKKMYCLRSLSLIESGRLYEKLKGVLVIVPPLVKVRPPWKEVNL